MSVSDAVEEVEDRLISAARGNAAVRDAAFVQDYLGTKMRCLGLRMPDQRRLFRQGYSFTTGRLPDQAQAWDEVWRRAKLWETRSQACFFLDRAKRETDLAALFSCACGWVDTVDNWAHSDSLSSFFVRLLDWQPETVYPVLANWNVSADAWKRRQSVVSLVVRARSRRTPLAAQQILPLVENLLDDSDHLVQRGVGWTLREAHQLYPEETSTFVRGNATRLSSIAFSAATEKYDKGGREALKEIRRVARRR